MAPGSSLSGDFCLTFGVNIGHGHQHLCYKVTDLDMALSGSTSYNVTMALNGSEGYSHRVVLHPTSSSQTGLLLIHSNAPLAQCAFGYPQPLQPLHGGGCV